MKWPTAKLGQIAPPKRSARGFGPDQVVWHLNLDQIESQTGRIQPDYGLDEGQGEQDKTIVYLLPDTVWQSTWADYCETSQSFILGKDCLVEIAGTG
jgi:hypothetical protein